MQSKAIILLAGGIDSATCLALAKSQGFACYALTFNYGQKHNAEIEAARKLAAEFQVIEHKVLSLPLNEWGGSSLTDARIQVPDYQTNHSISPNYVPARNTIFLSIALAWAEVLRARDIFFGANLADYQGFPDCRPEFFDAMTKAAQLGTKIGDEISDPFKIQTPLLYLNKAEIIELGRSLGVDFSKTVTCYRATPEGLACGNCDSCTLRKKAFAENNLPDPTRYAIQSRN